jgi:hypothetical protein
MMSQFTDVQHFGHDIPDDQLPIKLGRVFLPPNLHKFLRIKEGESVMATHNEVLQLITCFHPSTIITGNLSNPQTLFGMFEIFVLPWIRGFKSMDYETNIMEFSTD